jgi:hypothetical protein
LLVEFPLLVSEVELVRQGFLKLLKALGVLGNQVHDGLVEGMGFFFDADDVKVDHRGVKVDVVVIKLAVIFLGFSFTEAFILGGQLVFDVLSEHGFVVEASGFHFLVVFILDLAVILV